MSVINLEWRGTPLILRTVGCRPSQNSRILGNSHDKNNHSFSILYFHQDMFVSETYSNQNKIFRRRCCYFLQTHFVSLLLVWRHTLRDMYHFGSNNFKSCIQDVLMICNISNLVQLKSLVPKSNKSTFGTSEKNRFLWRNLYTCLYGKTNLDLKRNVFAWVIWI